MYFFTSNKTEKLEFLHREFFFSFSFQQLYIDQCLDILHNVFSVSKAENIKAKIDQDFDDEIAPIKHENGCVISLKRGSWLDQSLAKIMVIGVPSFYAVAIACHILFIYKYCSPYNINCMYSSLCGAVASTLLLYYSRRPFSADLPLTHVHTLGLRIKAAVKATQQAPRVVVVPPRSCNQQQCIGTNNRNTRGAAAVFAHSSTLSLYKKMVLCTLTHTHTSLNRKALTLLLVK